MTKEARNYLLKGEILAGLQTYEQDSAPIFPLSKSVASYLDPALQPLLLRPGSPACFY
jgi:hypothetical protein